LRLAVIADTHSNVTALSAVLEEISRRKLENVVLAGDLVGYGPDPNEVIELISDQGIISIRGNHDRACSSGDFSRMNPFAATAAEWTRNVLDRENLEMVRGLRDEMVLEIGGRSIGVYHGSPRDPDEYVSSTDTAHDFLTGSDVDLLLAGHTHVPMVARCGERLFLNPGAVGQPRDGNPDSSFAEIDLDSLDVCIVRVSYDIPSVQERMKQSALPEFLARRLTSGR